MFTQISLFYNYLIYLTNWWPWFDMFLESFFLQLLIIYCIFLIVFYNNIYYTLFYMFVVFFLIGCFLCFFQAELFTAFLWLAEFTIIFIFMLILFYLNVKGFYNSSFVNTYQNKILTIFFICFFSFFDFNQINNLFDYYVFYDDFYESVFNSTGNDLFGLFLSFYYINNFEFILVGFLLFIGSIFCVNFYKLNVSLNSHKNISFFKFFNFYKDFLSFFFLRRQNLNKQTNTKETIKFFKKI